MSKRSERDSLYFFIFPTFIILLAVVIFPMVFLYYISLTNYEVGMQWANRIFVGTENFIRLFSGKDPEFYESIKITLVFFVLATGIEFILGLGIALLFYGKNFKGKSLLLSLLIIPMAMTPAVVGLVWKLLYNSEYGVLNFLLQKFFGIKVVWLGYSMAFVSVLIVDIWQWTPFMALIIYAGLQSLPAEPYEAGLIDGATNLQIFRYITLPLLKPIILLSILLRSIDALKFFDVPYVLTKGGPGSSTEFLSLHVFRLAFAQTGWIGRASATAVILLIIVVVFTTILIRVLRKSYEGGH